MWGGGSLTENETRAQAKRGFGGLIAAKVLSHVCALLIPICFDWRTCGCSWRFAAHWLTVYGPAVRLVCIIKRHVRDRNSTAL